VEEVVHSILFGFINTIGLNIVPRKKLHFALCATCSKRKKTSGKGTNAFTDGGWSS
jgi:hypothetical protein